LGWPRRLRHAAQHQPEARTRQFRPLPAAGRGHKHKIGFKGTILIEPKPHEPTKHQYDFDTATVYGFLKKNGLENEVKVNIEANHATLAVTASITRSRWPMRSASSAPSTSTAAIRRTAGTPTSSTTIRST
jgi:hypothetical protein